MCQSVNLFRKLAAYNVSSVSAYFCDAHKINLQLYFRSSFNMTAANEQSSNVE